MGKTAKAAYLQLKRNYEKIQPKEDADEKKIPVDNEEPADDPPQNLIESDDTYLESFNKIFNIENAAIFEIESRSMKHRNKEVDKMVVKPGWTSKLALFLWKETKLSCKFNLRVSHVTNNKVIKVNAKCDCGANLEVSCDQKNLSVDINNINKNFEHKRKYQATGELKKDLSEVLKHSSALKVQTDKINELIPDNEMLLADFVPVMQSLNTYRVIKCLEQKTDEDPIDALLDWKESIYKDVITLVSLSPFTVHYRTALQLTWYIAQSKIRRMSVSIDATGSIVRPPRKSQKMDGSDKLKHVFLYTVMAKFDSKSVAIGQMITQDQTSENLEFFLKKMFKYPIKPPEEFVCDESKAMLKALVSAYTTCDGIVPYIDYCMSSLQTGSPPPKCQIRFDRSHFVKNVTKKIKHRDHRKRNFYRCVIGYLINCDDFNIAKKIIADFFTIILN